MTFPVRTRRLALGAGAVLALALGATTALAADHAVSIVGTKFDPAPLTVAVGDTVTWTVTESIGAPHTVTSGKLNDPNAGTAFDSGNANLQENGETFEHTFDTAGVYDYFCRIHPVDMTGQITVLAPGQSAPAVEGPPSEVETGIPPERRLMGAGILVLTLVVCFGGAAVWRRMNPA
jgi:plastocyanin